MRGCAGGILVGGERVVGGRGAWWGGMGKEGNRVPSATQVLDISSLRVKGG